VFDFITLTNGVAHLSQPLFGVWGLYAPKAGATPGATPGAGATANANAKGRVKI